MALGAAAERAPLLQSRDENKPKPGAIAAAVRQAKRGVGVFGVALALSGVLVAVLNAPDTSKTAFELQMAATTPAATSADEPTTACSLAGHHDDASRQEGVDRSFSFPHSLQRRSARDSSPSPRDAFAASRETPNSFVYTYPPASAASAARSFAWSRSGQ